MEVKFLSDAQIEKQYENFIVEEMKVEKCRYSDGFSGYICITFLKADHPDFDNYVCDNWIMYDFNGKIAFDNWYPTGVYLSLCKKIRDEIKKIA